MTLTQFLMLNTILTAIALSIIGVRSITLKFLEAKAQYSLWVILPISAVSFILCSQLVEISPIGTNFSTVDITVPIFEKLAYVEYSAPINSLSFMWLLGSFAVFSCVIFSEIAVSKLKKSAFDQLNTPYQTEVFISKEISHPALMGFLSPFVIVPESFQQLSQVRQDYILKHETTHLSRFDLQINLIAWVFVSLFWFNPIVWLSYIKFRQDQELACDSDTTKHFSGKQKQEYCQTILEVSMKQHSPNLFHLQFGSNNMIKERVMNLKTIRNTTKVAMFELSVVRYLTD